jgi:glycosyltransferase involved in cell wall biosynthesis
MTLSVIVSTRGRPQQLARCLDALLAQTAPAEQILVVNQSPDDATAAVCADRGVERLADTGVGLSRARNIGLAAATGEIVACLDDDCWAGERWAESLRGALERHPEAAGVLGSVLPGGDGHGSDVEVSTVEFASERLTSGWAPPWEVGFGGNMALRAECWRRLGPAPFDVRLGAGSPGRAAEDMDLIYRVLRGGGSLVSAPEMWVRHEQWRRPEALARHMFGYAIGAGAYSTKHLVAGDRGGLRLLGRHLHADLRFLASGVRRRSAPRARIGLARLGGSARGIAAGLRLGWEDRHAA